MNNIDLHKETNMDELVSVIVPVYNVEKYLNECMNSVVQQSYKNLEIILVDDGATDSSGDLCDEWEKKDNRITVIHKKNAGLGFARNSGLEVVTGKYVMFIDSDDYIHHDMIETLVRKVKISQSDTVFCGLSRVYTDGTIIGEESFYDNQTFVGTDVVDKVLLEMVGSTPEQQSDANLYMSVWHAVYSMDIIQKYHIEFPSEREIMSEDIVFHIDYLRHAQRVTYIKDCLYFYRMNPQSLTQVFDKNRFERYKTLYYAISEKLSMFLYLEQYQVRQYRRLLAGARGQIMAVVYSNEPKKLVAIQNICGDDLVQEILAVYPYQKNPIKHRIFNWGLKHKYVKLLYLMAILRRK